MQRLFHWLRYNWLYLGRPPWDTGISPPELLEFIRLHPPGCALDLGCGTGTNLLTLAKSGWQVTGVDFAPRAMHEARRKFRRAGVEGLVRQGDVTRLETVRGLYDLVLDIGCYHGLLEAGRAAYRQNLVQILAPGGYYLLYARWKTNTGDPFGITQADFEALNLLLFMEERQDSQDRFGRLATWIRFRSKKV